MKNMKPKGRQGRLRGTLQANQTIQLILCSYHMGSSRGYSQMASCKLQLINATAQKFSTICVREEIKISQGIWKMMSKHLSRCLETQREGKQKLEKLMRMFCPGCWVCEDKVWLMSPVSLRMRYAGWVCFLFCIFTLTLCISCTAFEFEIVLGTEKLI